MALSEERRGQIALALVKARFRRDGLRLSPAARRELGATAAETGVPIEELEQFVFELLPEMVGDAFGFERVSITTEGRKRIHPQAQAGHGDRETG
jgi:hypothetical protein